MRESSGVLSRTLAKVKLQHYKTKKKPYSHFINLIPSVKHGGGSIMVWTCFAASGPGQLAIIDGTMNSELYQQILKENVRTSVQELNLKRKCVMQQDNDPKNTSCSTKEWLKEDKANVLERMSPDLNPIEILWKDP
uniref:Uncharacterized protein n=1 Tax=Cyprinus carpio carpio TaxID=630221 RepID=A0A9J7Y0N0_CYPCA